MIFPDFFFKKMLLSVGLWLSTATAVTKPWAHSWDTAGAAWWGDFGYNLLTEPQAEFVAKNYFLASLEKCTGRGQGLTTEDAIYQTVSIGIYHGAYRPVRSCAYSHCKVNMLQIIAVNDKQTVVYSKRRAS